MDIPDVLSRLTLALGIGLLIGLERGWRTREAEAGNRAAGIRTFAISGLLGSTAGAIATASGGVASVGGGILLAVAFATYAAALSARASAPPEPSSAPSQWGWPTSIPSRYR
jgi:hypothetical protein